ncbi:MAG: TonB-dependent receptor [Agriterribacter sp.]
MQIKHFSVTYCARLFTKQFAPAKTQTWLAMKMTILLLMAGFLQVSARGYSQQITFSGKKVPLEKIFSLIEEQTDYVVFYNYSAIRGAKSVTVKANALPLEQFLQECFKEQPFKFTVEGKTILIARKDSVNHPSPDALEKTLATEVNGRVLDEEGNPLEGVSVIAKQGNTEIASGITNKEGSFSLTGLKMGATYDLHFSYVGYETYIEKNVVVREEISALPIQLKKAENNLNQVVVVGYGTQRKVNLTGAVASISSKEIMEGNFTNTATLLQGRLPGLQIVQNSGAPGGEGTSLKIRGYGTFSGAGADPLIIIDGVAGGDINTLSPENIESISVLKDAASAAIYGARAANGVILIQTKSGKQSEKLVLNYHGNVGIYKATKLPDLIWNSVEYMELWNEAIANFNSGGTPYTEAQINLYRNPSDPKQYPNVNWLDELIKPRIVSNHSITANGRSGTTSYYLSAGYINQPGTFNGYKMNRSNFQANMDSRLSKYVELGTKIGVIVKNRDYPVGDVSGDGVDPLLSTMAQRPTYAPQLPDGSGRYTLNAFPNETNNKNTLLVSTENLYHAYNKSYQLQGYLKLNFNAHLNLLGTVAFAGSFDELKGMNDKNPLYNFITGELSSSFGTNNLTHEKSNNNLTTVNSYLNYNRAFGVHKFNLVAGSSLETYKYSVLGGARVNFITNTLEELDAGPLENQTNYGNAQEWALLSYFGRLNYNYDERYLLEINSRYDGSSRFSKENRWGFFPSVSAGWKINNEKFFKVNWVDELKIRGSWGKLGNQQISSYPYQALLTIAGNYPFGNTLSSGVRQTSLNNRNITWESTTITDIGLNATLFRGKLTFVFDYFNKRTTDILRSADVPLEIGLSAPLINDGIVENKGFELGINTKGRLIGNFSYDIGGFISAYKNKLIKYGSTSYGASYINQEGHPLETYYLWEVAGIFQSQDEISRAATQSNNPQPGDLRYKDQNGDNIINSQDRVYMKGRHPDFDYSFNIGINYKNFSLNSLFYGVEGRKFYTGQWGYEPFRQGSPPPEKWRNRWTPQNPSTTMPRIYPDGNKSLTERSEFFLEDASYFRLRSLDLTYTFPAGLTRKIGSESIVIYLSGQNLFTLTRFSGYDPERVNDGVRGGVRYPQNKVYALGTKIRF